MVSENRNKTKPFISISLSLSILGSFLILLSFAAILYFLLNQQLQAYRSQSRIYAETLINNLVQAIELSEYNQEWLQAYAVAVGTNPGISRVAILDDNGVIIAHSDPKQQGRKFSDISVLQSQSPNMTSFFLNDSSHSSAILRVVSPVEQFSDESKTIRYVLADMELHDKIWDIATSDTLILLIVMLGLVAFNILALSLFVRHRIIKKLKILRRGSERIAEGVFTERISINRNNELGQLASAFNLMAESLSETTVSRDFFNSILRSMGDSLFVLDADLNIIRVNKASLSLLGYDERELIGTIMLDHVEYQGEKPSPPFCHLQDKPSQEVFFITKDGQKIPVLISSSFIQSDSDDNKIFICIAKDITELKKTEESLRRSEKSLKEAQQIAGLGNWDFDLVKNIVHWSEEAYRIFEVNPDNLNPTYQSFLDTVHPEDRDAVNKAYNESLFNKTPYDINYRLLMHDGRVKYIHARCDSHYDTDGRPLRSIGTVQDITKNKMEEIEKERLRGQLTQAQKMEAVGTLAGGIAHDFNNLLTIIIGNTELTMFDMPEASKGKKQLTQVKQAANRARDLVKQILSFSRKSDQEFLPFQPAVIVKEVYKLLRSTIPTTVEIRLEIDPDCGFIVGDSTQIHQILMNLSSNAVHAMQENGVLEIRLEKTFLNDDDLQNHPEMVPGIYIRLTISDTGIGMDEQTLARIFDPFFTTKEVDKGTGMGLSVVHGIVTAHHGMITVDSTPGRGTIFTVYFPMADIAPPDQVEDIQVLPGGTERILIVDDEEQIASMWENALSRLGYQVTTRTNSSDAMQLFRDQAQEFDLVITDQTMPGITGVELSEKLMEIRPDIPIILCSGFSSKITPEDAIGLKVKRFLFKPVDIAQLAKEIREILDEK